MSEGGRVSNMEIEATKHTGRFPQMIIYLGKLFRMFIFQNDWKVLPMSAIIAGLVSFAVGGSLFKTMEGTMMGTFALACVCIWNGFFNSIQVVCRERAIIKREHRSGLHITSYIAAHVIYQAVLCMAQSAITLIVLHCGYDVTYGIFADQNHNYGHDGHAVSADIPACLFGRIYQPA